MKKTNSHKVDIFIFCFILLVAYLTSCKTKASSKFEDNEWYFENISTQASDTSAYVNYYVARFYPDNSYSIFASNHYNFGTWKWMKPNEQIKLHSLRGDLNTQDAIWIIQQINSSNLKVNVYQKKENGKYGTAGSMNATGIYCNSDKDPFNLKNNMWRFAPTQKESDSVLKNHTISYLHFLEKLYQHTVDNKFTSMHYDWFPQPLKMQFSNGVQMAYNDELSDWYPCFFDSAQAVKAYQLIGGGMYKAKLKSTDNIAERNADYIHQIIENIKLK